MWRYNAMPVKKTKSTNVIVTKIMHVLVKKKMPISRSVSIHVYLGIQYTYFICINIYILNKMQIFYL